MDTTETERLLNLIGQILRDDLDHPLADTLLYAEVDTNMVGAAVFKSLGNQVLYRRQTSELFDILLDLWEQTPVGKRWAEMEYVLRDRRFETKFIYSNEIDPDEDSDVRRDRIVARYFGDKPIVYPPWETSEQDFTL